MYDPWRFAPNAAASEASAAPETTQQAPDRGAEPGEARDGCSCKLADHLARLDLVIQDELG